MTIDQLLDAAPRAAAGIRLGRCESESPIGTAAWEKFIARGVHDRVAPDMAEAVADIGTKSPRVRPRSFRAHNRRRVYGPLMPRGEEVLSAAAREGR